MIITAIEVRKRHLTAIILSEAFSCDDAFCDAAGNLLLQTEYAEELFLKEGQEVDEEWLTEVCHESAYRRCLSKGMWYLSRRSHCSGEIYKKLVSEYTDIVCYRVLSRLQELGLIDDRAFAVRLAEQLIEEKGISPRAAALHMAAKGVDMDLAKEVISQREDDPLVPLKALVEKKYIRSVKTEKDYKKAVASLMRKGYNYGEVKAVFSQYELNFNDEEFGD